MLDSLRRAAAQPRVDPVAAGKPVLDLDGTPRPLGSLWSKGPVVLVFLRHFG